MVTLYHSATIIVKRGIAGHPVNAILQKVTASELTIR
jgi:hypothetical protein